MSEPSSEDDLTLLGKSESRLPPHPDEAKLETFPNRNSHRDYTIELDYPEFNSLCPVTGQPDSAHITITFTIIRKEVNAGTDPGMSRALTDADLLEMKDYLAATEHVVMV